MINQSVRRVIILLAILTSLVSEGVLAAAPMLLNDDFTARVVEASYLELLEDPGDSLSINKITTLKAEAFSEVTSDTINMGHSASSIWARFAIKDQSKNIGTKNKWLLEIGYPLLKRVEVFVVEGSQVEQSYSLGYAMEMGQREVQNRVFVQPIYLKPGREYHIYVNVMRKNGSIQLPLKIYRPNAFLTDAIKSNYVFGMFFGILFAMIIYNTYLFVSVGSRAYFYYILYIAFASTAFLTTTGYGFLLFWSQHPFINEYALQIPSSLAAITGLLFVRHFIGVKQYSVRYDRWISALVAVGGVLITVRLLTDYFLSEVITVYIALLSTVAPIMAVKCYRSGSRSAGFFLLGWATLFVGILLYTLSMLAILPSNSITSNAVLVGAALETLLLSLGLADRINTERRQKMLALEAQHKADLQLKATENQLIHSALHSGVTGLPNRTFLRTLIESNIKNSDNEKLVLVLISLNNFHEINKTLGHSNGDAVLYLITQKINTLCEGFRNIVEVEQHNDGAHYLTGVEGITFACLVKDDAIEDVQSHVLGLLKNLEQPIKYQGLSLDVDASASLAVYPEHGHNSETLIRNAHIALEAAATNNEKLAIYSQSIDPYSERRISLVGELREAIQNDELQLYVQPQISLLDNQVIGAEVLVRWIHPDFGFIPPDEFIPIAEKTGVIHSLTYWVCRKAFEYQAQLEAMGVGLKLSINISARNLQDANFKHQIVSLAKEQGVSLSEFVMELTETAVMTDPDNALKMMKMLHDEGITLSIDDFGTGYSSLSYLKKLPVSELKIDKSFVTEMAQNKEDQLLVRTSLNMGRNFAMKVVAEGIEDEVTLGLLREMGCDVAQGYHIARPMPGQDFNAWLADYVGFGGYGQQNTG